MEKSSLNIKSFRNLLSNQSKSYKIPPDNYQPTEVKIINGAIIDNAANCSIEDIYSIKHHKSNNVVNNEQRCDQKRIHDMICGNFIKFFSHYNSNFCLPICTPISSSICVIIVIAALFGTSWISTEEKIPWLQVNSSFYRTNNFSVSYVIKSSNASLWIICTRLALDDNRTKTDFTHKNCTRINYFDVDKYQPDPRDSTNDSTNVIPYTITLSSPLLIISFIILLISYLLFLLAICSQKYKIFYFVAGILFIISGLLMLSGLIMFISIFKSEVFHKLRPSNVDPVFNFHYGHSFMLYVIGFIAVELAGILNVCLFNNLQKAEELNQNRLLNNYIKPGHTTSSSTASNHHSHIAYPNMENGYIPRNNLHCSMHTASSAIAPNIKVTNDYLSMPLRTAKSPLHHHHVIDSTNRFNAFNHVPFTRNASTSTLDLDNEHDDGDLMSGKSNRRILKDKSNNNKLDFNNICGMMRTNKSKDCNANSNMYHRIKPAKNIYYIKDQNDDEEPNIFIVDPRFYKNRKCALQKSLEDIRMQKLNNNTFTSASQYRHHNACNGWNNTLTDRSFCGSKTLPRDFSRPKQVRPSLGSFLENFYQESNENRLNQLNHSHNHHHSHHNLHNHYHSSGHSFHHHNSCDELSSLKSNRSPYCRNFFDPQQHQQVHQQEYQWPKVIPKSPSSFSMNSFRINRHAAMCDDGKNYNPIEGFDLDKIENERRKSHTNLFKECRQNDFKKEFGTAV